MTFESATVSDTISSLLHKRAIAVFDCPKLIACPINTGEVDTDAIVNTT